MRCISNMNESFIYVIRMVEEKKEMWKFHETREHRDSVIDVPIFIGRRGIAIKVVTIDIASLYNVGARCTFILRTGN